MVVVDTEPPTSTAAPLPPMVHSTSFTVTWSGSDNAGGSGIASYDVYVSDDGGPFTAFLKDTTATSATFNGDDGHTFGFYSIATDSAGNVQPTPMAAQAITSVNTPSGTQTPAPLVTVESLRLEKVKVGNGKKAKKESVSVLQFSGASMRVPPATPAPTICAGHHGEGAREGQAQEAAGNQAWLAIDSGLGSLQSPGQPGDPDTTRLNLKKPAELIVNAMLITDAMGRDLDGNDDGQPGGDYIATLSGGRVSVGGLPSARTGERPATVPAAIDALLARGELIRLIRSPSARTEA